MDPRTTDDGARTAPRITLNVDIDRIVRAAPDPETPFRIGVVGDFRGHARPAAGAPDLGARAPLAIDRDDFDDVLAACAPSLRLALDDGPPIEIGFRELDDFHPDRLYDRLPLFRSLRELRRRLADPATFAAAAQELRSGPSTGPESAPTPPPAAPRPRPSAGGSLLDEIVDAAPDAAPPPAGPRDELAEFIRRAVRPSVVAAPDARQPDALAQVDAATAGLMRSILHHPEFRALEALWRGVHLLVRRVETGTRLKLYLIDAAAAELDADLAPERAAEEESGLLRLLRRPLDGTGSPAWAVLVGAQQRVEPEAAALRQLRRLGRIARELGAVWVAAGDARLAGAASFGEHPDPDDWTLPSPAEWDELRQAPEAESVGLVMPRLLLRVPYGADAEPCDTFDFEEFAGRPPHEALLWGSGALACAVLLAQTFAEQGWSMRPGAHRELAGLPFHLVREPGQVEAVPCAEMPMSERAAERILDAGAMPLAWLKDSDAALLVRFQSIAAPLAPLAGRWAGTPAG